MDKATLINRRDELRARIAAIRRDLASGLEDDLEEQAQQLENYDTLLEICRLAEDELDKVEATLREHGES